MSDEELFIKCRKGDTSAFRSLYEKYSKPLLNYIHRILGDYESSKDIFQTTFLRVLTKSFTPQARFSTWLYKVATNLCYTELKKNKRTLPLSDKLVTLLPDNNKTAHQIVEQEDLIKNIGDSLLYLTEIQRTVFCLRFYEDKSYEEIAEILDIPVGTVKSRLHYAVKALQDYFRRSL